MKYLDLARVYEQLESTSKRLEKTNIIAEFLKKVEVAELPRITILLQGKLFPSWDEQKIGVAARLIIKAIKTSAGVSEDKIEEKWKKTGDLGKTAELLMGKKTQQTLFSRDLPVKKVFDNLRKLATLEGQGTVDLKVKIIAELLSSAKPLEARYLVRTILEELRVGVGDGSMRDAIAWAFFAEKMKFSYKDNKIEVEDREEYNKYIHAVQHAYDLTNDFSTVTEVAKKSGLNGLLNVKITVGKPIKVMLALKAVDAEDGLKRVGVPAAIEYKYDGFRIQIHKDKDIRLFTRRLEDVTAQFPEVVKYAQEHVKGDSYILDSEAVGFNPKTKKYLPFQNISQRIRRKYNIEQMSKDFPVEVNVFDIIYYNGKSLIKEDFKDRRALLEKIIKPMKFKIVLAKNVITKSIKEIEKFYKESLKAGNEGIMLKKLDAPYKPGARVGYMVKLKPTMETLDLVIVGAEWGEGKRANWLSSFTLACMGEKGYVEIGKVGTGIKEKSEGVSFEQLTELLKPLIITEKGKKVRIKPKIVVEVSYEEIQKSPTYSSGYALRFPRIARLRDDKSAKDSSDLSYVEELYFSQKK